MKTILLVALVLFASAAEGQAPSEDLEREAGKAWNRYVREGDFGFVGYDGVLRVLWSDHVKPELKNPRYQMIGIDWANKLFYSWTSKPLGESDFPGIADLDPISETVQLLPVEVLEVIADAEGQMSEGRGRMAEILAGTPERIEATVDMLAQYSDAENPFVAEFAEHLRAQSGETSRAELKTMEEVGLIEPSFFDNAVKAVRAAKSREGAWLPEGQMTTEEGEKGNRKGNRGSLKETVRGTVIKRGQRTK